MASPSAKPVCRHCGSPLLDERARDSGFCCAGCAYVYRLVHEHGLAGYYQLKDSVTAPADPSVFQPRDYGWLERLQKEAEDSLLREGEKTVGTPSASLSIQGISCAGCVWLIERLFMQERGARDVFVNAQTGEMRLRWIPGDFSLSAFAGRLQSFGYLLGPLGEENSDPESRGLVKRIGLCTAFAMNVMLFTLPTYFGMDRNFAYARLFDTISLGFATLSVLVGGSLFMGRAFRSLREGALHIDLPIAIGIVGSYVGSLYGWLAHRTEYLYFDFVSTFILLMLVGRWAQVVMVERNQRQLLRQQLKAPRVRLRNADGTFQEATPEKLAAGSRFELGPGQTLPVEAQLERDDCSFSLASINGESEPRLFRAGEIVPAGALNIGMNPAPFVARQTWSESLLSKLLGGGERHGWRHRFLERIIQGYLIGIFVLSALSGIVWWVLTQDPVRTGAVVTAVLVVSCPCAIGLAFPLADEMAAVALRRRGVFVRENDLWGKLSRVKRLLFDKTGTLTLETPELLNPETLKNLPEEAASALRALAGSNSHPVSQALVAELLAHASPAPLPGALREFPGKGVELSAPNGDRWTLGNPAWLRHAETSASDSLRERGPEVLLCKNGSEQASFRFADRVRSDASSELARLRELGFDIFVLSGDHPEKVRKLADELSIPEDHCLGGLSPEEKAAWLERNGQQDSLMLGDGANDSLAFDRALCRGTPVIHRGILEQKADFFYLGRGIGGIRALFAVDQVRRKTQTLILVVSALYNLAAVGLAAAGHMNPLLAAVLMPANSLLAFLLVTTGMKRAFSV